MAVIRDDAYWSHVRSIVDAAPPFTERQAERLAVLFRPHVAAVSRARETSERRVAKRKRPVVVR